MRSKVRRHRRSLTGLAAAALLVLGACETGGTEEEPTDAVQEPVPGRFGAPYEIVLGRAPADPDMPPAIDDDTLRALVAYPGGCEDHDFELARETSQDTVRLWLRHDAGGDDCEAMIADEVRVPLPEADLEGRTVVLENPHGGPPFMLRW